MLESFKEELQKRKTEEQHLQEELQIEKQKIAEERANQKKSVFRKIKPVDNAFAKKERAEDQKRLSEVSQRINKDIMADRAERRNSFIAKNKKTIVACCLVLAAVFVSVTVNGIRAYENQMQNKYNEAVSYIVHEDYLSAASLMEDMDTREAQSIISYCNLQSNLASYAGNPKSFLVALIDLEAPENETILKQKEDTQATIENIIILQKELNAIDMSEINLAQKEEIEELTVQENRIPQRYRILLDDSNLVAANEVIENIENQTPVGLLICGIRGIGDVTLESESNVKALQESYNALSDAEKKQVVNYDTLKKSEKTINDLKAEEAEKAAQLAEQERLRAEAERQKAEQAKAEAEKAAEIKAQQQAASQSMDNRTVYLTRTGKCYHTAGCRTVRMSTATETTIKKAKQQGYEPCGICYPGW